MACSNDMKNSTLPKMVGRTKAAKPKAKAKAAKRKK